MVSQPQPKEQPKLPGGDVERYTRTPAAYAQALHGGGLGTVSVGRARRREPGLYQRRLPVERALQHARKLRGEQDVYMSLNRYGSGLGTRNLISLSALYADLDYYNVPKLAKYHPYEVLEMVLERLRDEGISNPTHAIGSGRGLYLIWQHHPVRPEALTKWRRVSKRLSEVLHEFGADAAVGSDPARVLRLPGTVNSTNGGKVEPLLPVGETYKFGQLADTVLPVNRAKLYDLRKERKARREGGNVPPQRTATAPEGYGSKSLAETRLRDLYRLKPTREAGRKRARSRWLCHTTAEIVKAASSPEAAREEARRLAEEVAGWSGQQADTRLGTILRKAEAAARGETVEYDGYEVDPRYRFRSETIIEALNITPAEQEHLETLIGQDERRRRRRDKERIRGREAGRMPREEYEGRAAQRRTEARRLAAEGRSRREIAEALGVSPASVTGYLREPEPEPPDPIPEGGSKSLAVYVPPVGGPCASTREGTEQHPRTEVAERPDPMQEAAPTSPHTPPLERPGPIPLLVTSRYKQDGSPEVSGNGEHVTISDWGERSRIRTAAEAPSPEGASCGPRQPAEGVEELPAGRSHEPAAGPKNPIPTLISGELRITQPRGSLTRRSGEVERGIVPPGPGPEAAGEPQLPLVHEETKVWGAFP